MPKFSLRTHRPTVPYVKGWLGVCSTVQPSAVQHSTVLCTSADALSTGGARILYNAHMSTCAIRRMEELLAHFTDRRTDIITAGINSQEE